MDDPRATMTGERKPLPEPLRPRALTGRDERGTLSGDDAPRGTLSGTLSGDGPPRGTLSGGDGEPISDGTDPDAGLSLATPDLDLSREIGRGGMGVVWLATQRSLSRPVAVKTLRPELLRGPAAARFEAEALVTGRLEHPHIPPVHAFGHDEAGNPYLSMKLVDGVEWAKLLSPRTEEEKARAAAIDLRGHLEILRRACDAVAFAHSRGVIHRDLKPENIMVGAFGEVLVMDWGIALVKAGPSPAPSPAPAPAPSPPRSAVGTPAYMAPEMADGRDDLVGPATDVFLLGGILYELLTGEPPHEGRGILETLVHAREGRVRPPAERAPGRAIAEELAEIAMRALEKEPARRFAGPAELARALDDWERHESSRALAAFGQSEIEGAAAAIAASGSAATVYARLAGGTAALVQAVESWPGNKAARAALARARVAYASYAVDRGDLALAESELERAGPDAPGAAEVRTRLARVHAEREADARRRRRLRRVLLGGACTLAIVLGVAVLQSWRASSSEAARALRDAAVAETVGDSGDASDRAARAESRAAAYERAVAIDPSWVEGIRERARAYVEVATYGDDTNKSAALLELAGTLLDRALELRPDDARAVSDRAYVAMSQGDWPRARALYERAARLDQEGKTGLRAAALCALDDGQPRQALSAFTLLKRSELSADDHFMIAVCHIVLGDLDPALASARRAEAMAGPDEWFVALIAYIRLARGELIEAGADLQRGIRADPPGPHLLPLLAYRAALLGDGERAARVLEAAKVAQARYARTYLMPRPFWTSLAKVPGKSGEVARAVLLDIDLPAITAAKPAPCVEMRKRAEALLEKGEWVSAVGEATRAIAEDPADGAARLARGKAFLALGQRSGAKYDLELVEALAPERAGEARGVLGGMK